MIIEHHHPSVKNRKAVCTIVFTVFALALGDALIKHLSASFTLWQIFCLRSAVVIPVLLVAIKIHDHNTSVQPDNYGWTILRSAMLTLMWITYYASLPHLDLAVAAAAYYTLPLFITLFAALLLGDSIGKTGWLAIVIGFVGVLLVLQPRPSDFNWYSLLPVSSAILYALAMILTRSRCKHENILVLSLWLNLTMLVCGVVASITLMLSDQTTQAVHGSGFLTGEWSAMGTREWLVIGLLSVAILIGSIGAAYAYQNGEPATIAAFDFAYVAFAVLWGIILFQELPGGAGASGMVLIVIAGVLAMKSKDKPAVDTGS